jgi:hypothetical protein
MSKREWRGIAYGIPALKKRCIHRVDSPAFT